MKELEGLRKATPEQIKEVSKILSRGRISLLFTTIKFSVGLFLSNLITIFIGNSFLRDANVNFQLGFQFVTMLTNFIFMTRYLDGQFHKNSDTVKNQIKEVLNKQ